MSVTIRGRRQPRCLCRARDAPAAGMRHDGGCASSPRSTSSGDGHRGRGRRGGRPGSRRRPAHVRPLPMADGGEGSLEVLGGANRTTMVTGPARRPGRGGVAARPAASPSIEMARASGLALVGGADGNDPSPPPPHGTGELIAAALDAGARRSSSGVGGSATTDGGLGASGRLYPLQRLAGRRAGRGLRRAHRASSTRPRSSRRRRAPRRPRCALLTPPARAAGPGVPRRLRRRRARRSRAAARPAAWPAGWPPSGAALVSGFDVVADELDLAERMAEADLVVTGEGFLDARVLRRQGGRRCGGLAAELGVPVLVVAGEVVRRRPTGRRRRRVAGRALRRASRRWSEPRPASPTSSPTISAAMV